jgi:predicted helicase
LTLPRSLAEGGATPVPWHLALFLARSGDEEEDWTRLSQEIRWLPELSTGERATLCGSLATHGVGLLACAGREEAEHRFNGVRGDRVQAVVLDPEERAAGWKIAAELRRRQGIFPTPPSLTAWVVRSVHALLQSRLGRPAGLADLDLRVLDPAAGPLNFVLEACRVVLENHREVAGEKGAETLVRKHLMTHFQGFEWAPQEYLRGALAFERFFAAQGYVHQGEIPLQLADALVPATFSGSPAVILGNPPWSGRSANRGRWIRALLQGYQLANGYRDEGYFRVDGEPLGERNSKWLLDDYVKFLRFAQWKIDQRGEGLVAFVINHNALDAPTFRGLRRSLLRTFDEIYALDLHGNRRKREISPEGGPDENVFAGIAQGAAILLLVKRPGLRKRTWRADFQGTREVKLRQLGGGSVETISWTEVHPRSPHYLFACGDAGLDREYRRGIPLTEIFPVWSPGIITGRDAWVTGFDRREIEEGIARLRRTDIPEPKANAVRGVGRLRKDSGWPRHLTSVLSRPFDVRHLFCAPYFLERPRRAVMGHMLSGANLGLIVPRQSRQGPAALVTRRMAGHKSVSVYNVNTLFPLYLYPQGSSARIANLSPALQRHLAERYGEAPAPEAVLAYIYAVLYSPPYRRRFREQLHRDFPRIPFPLEAGGFRILAELGEELLGLHLQRDPRLWELAARVEGDPKWPVGQFVYQEREHRLVTAEGGLCFEGIEPSIWRYQIGGYDVLSHWLKARRGRILSWSEIEEVRRISEALRLTIKIEQRIAEAHEGATVEEATC